MSQQCPECGLNLEPASLWTARSHQCERWKQQRDLFAQDLSPFTHEQNLALITAENHVHPGTFRLEKGWYHVDYDKGWTKPWWAPTWAYAVIVTMRQHGRGEDTIRFTLRRLVMKAEKDKHLIEEILGATRINVLNYDAVWVLLRSIGVTE